MGMVISVQANNFILLFFFMFSSAKKDVGVAQDMNQGEEKTVSENISIYRSICLCLRNNKQWFSSFYGGNLRGTVS